MENEKSFIIELTHEDFQNELRKACPKCKGFTEKELDGVLQKLDIEYFDDVLNYVMDAVSDCVSKFIEYDNIYGGEKQWVRKKNNGFY